MSRQTEETRLLFILERVYKFPHNVNLTDLVGAVYGRTETNQTYLRSKVELIDRKGFTWWYCDLDNDNRRKVAGFILDRYGDLFEKESLTPVQRVSELLGEMDAQEFEEVLLKMGELARKVNSDNPGAPDDAWSETAAYLQSAWCAVQERRGN